jgi:hypothetical protein
MLGRSAVLGIGRRVAWNRASCEGCALTVMLCPSRTSDCRHWVRVKHRRPLNKSGSPVEASHQRPNDRRTKSHVAQLGLGTADDHAAIANAELPSAVKIMPSDLLGRSLIFACKSNCGWTFKTLLDVCDHPTTMIGGRLAMLASL